MRTVLYFFAGYALAWPCMRGSTAWAWPCRGGRRLQRNLRAFLSRSEQDAHAARPAAAGFFRQSVQIPEARSASRFAFFCARWLIKHFWHCLEYALSSSVMGLVQRVHRPARIRSFRFCQFGITARPKPLRLRLPLGTRLTVRRWASPQYMGLTRGRRRLASSLLARRCASIALCCSVHCGLFCSATFASFAIARRVRW